MTFIRLSTSPIPSRMFSTVLSSPGRAASSNTSLFIFENFHGVINVTTNLLPQCSQHVFLVEYLSRQLLYKLVAVDELVFLFVEVLKVTLE